MAWYPQGAPVHLAVYWCPLRVPGPSLTDHCCIVLQDSIIDGADYNGTDDALAHQTLSLISLGAKQPRIIKLRIPYIAAWL